MVRKCNIAFKLFICVILAISLICSLVACKDTKETTDNVSSDSKMQSSSSLIADTSDDSSEQLSSEEVGNIEEVTSSDYDDVTSEDIIDLPDDLFDDDPLPEDYFDGDNWEDEIPPEDDLSYGKYDNPIQCYGAAVKGTTRTINVDVNDVVWENFYGFGTNFMANSLAEQEKIGYNEAFFEFDMNHEKMLNSQVWRLVFQLDYMVTSEEPNYYRRDIENNKDYQNYMNGIYDFDNKNMKSIYAYLDKSLEMDSKILLDFGWKTNDRITNWYALPVFLPTASAPYDLDAYARACVALYKNFVSLGYDNVDYITFFNEPQNSEDFLTVGDSVSWYSKMVIIMDKEFKKAGLRDEIELWGPEQGQTTLTYHNYVRDFANTKGVADVVDCWSIHRYYKGKSFFENNYYEYFNDMVLFVNEFGKRICCTEMEAFSGPYEIAYVSEDVYYDWNDTYSSYIIASLNSGVKSVCAWGFGEYYWSFPLNGWMGYGTMYKHTDKNIDSIAPVGQAFEEIGLLNTYITPNCDVLMNDWTGDDIRVAAVRLADGNYTVIVETMGGDSRYDVRINFSESIGKTFYRFDTDRLEEKVVDYTIPSVSKTFKNIDNTISDALPGKDAAVYFYTTKEPLKQISINNYKNYVKSNETLKLGARLIDCENEEIVWSISASSGEKGTITSTGELTAEYVPSNEAVSGDVISVRAALKSNPNIYMTALVQIV